MMDVQILKMDDEHVTAVAEMEKLCFPVPWSENSVRNELRNPLSLWLVAVCDGQVIGYVGSQSAAGESDIMNLAVHPDFRNRGLGLQLMQELMTHLRQDGILALLLEVRVSNAAAIALYEKLGFVTVGIRPNYYFSPREDARIMRKELIES